MKKTEIIITVIIPPPQKTQKQQPHQQNDKHPLFKILLALHSKKTWAHIAVQHHNYKETIIKNQYY